MLLFQAITQLFPEPFLIPLEMATGLSWPNDIITMWIIYSTVGHANAGILIISADQLAR